MYMIMMHICTNKRLLINVTVCNKQSVFKARNKSGLEEAILSSNEVALNYCWNIEMFLYCEVHL